MINKKGIIAIVVIFLLISGLLTYSFAATDDSGGMNNNYNGTNSGNNSGNQNDGNGSQNGGNSNIGFDKDDENENPDANGSGTSDDDPSNDSSNVNGENSGSNSGNQNSKPNNNGSNNSGNNSGSGSNNGGSTKPSNPDTPTEPTPPPVEPKDPIPVADVDKAPEDASGVDVNQKPLDEINTLSIINVTGYVPKRAPLPASSGLGDAEYYVILKIEAPKIYSQETLNKMRVRDLTLNRTYGVEALDSSDASQRAYFNAYINVETVNQYTFAIDWGDGVEITYQIYVDVTYGG